MATADTRDFHGPSITLSENLEAPLLSMHCACSGFAPSRQDGGKGGQHCTTSFRSIESQLVSLCQAVHAPLDVSAADRTSASSAIAACGDVQRHGAVGKTGRPSVGTANRCKSVQILPASERAAVLSRTMDSNSAH
jgi:hypothetical protein